MSERQEQPFRSGERTARGGTPLSGALDVRRGRTVPERPPVRTDAEEEPTILGFPAEVEDDDRAESFADRDADAIPGPAASDRGSVGGPDSAVRLVVLRHPDRIAGLVLVLAGVAAAVSLWLPWVQGEGATGLSLVRRGVDVFGSGIGELGRSGLWQPLAVVLGGGILFLLGLLLFLPARTHRLVGVLALLVAVAAAAGVLVPLADADWNASRFDLGMLFAVAAAGLGVLGSLKAMLTTPRVALERSRQASVSAQV